jgi:hypothetical protein
VVDGGSAFASRMITWLKAAHEGLVAESARRATHKEMQKYGRSARTAQPFARFPPPTPTND